MVSVPNQPRRALGASNARGVLLSSCIGKAYIATFREPMVAELVGKAPSQFASHSLGGVDLASFTIQLFRRWTSVEKLPAALLFVDLRAAFYSVLADLALGPLETEANRHAVYRRIGLPAEDVVDIEREIQARGASRGHIDEPTLQATRDWHRAPWYEVDGDMLLASSPSGHETRRPDC